jgi:hypothetical protein
MTSRDAAALVQEEKEVEAAKRIAGLVGPALIAITTSEVVNLDFVEEQYRFYSYANGTVVFVAGLAIVRAHNRWTRGWPVVVTLTGWGTMFLGLFRMFAPEAKQGGASIPTFIGIAIPFAAGVFLTFKAYWPRDNKTAAR